MRWRLASIAALLALAALAAVVLRFGPAASLAASLAAPAAESWLAVGRWPPARHEIAIPASAGTLQADVYRPRRPRSALLLVHGLSRWGRRQPDLERLARLLASHGLIVVVPQFEGMAAFRLTGQEVADIRAALRETAAVGAAHGVDQVGVAGFSFGAGPTLIAAADVPELRVVGSFGGYADLLHVIAFITTGTHEFGGRRHVRTQEEYNRWKMLAMVGPLVAGDEERRRLEMIAERRLANPADDTAAVERQLGAEGQAVLALVVNRREDRVAPLVDALPPRARAALARLSPLPAVPRIRGRLLIAHGIADESIPYTESLRLAAAAGDRAHLAVFETFHHTGPQPLWRSMASRIGDGRKLLGLVDELLGR
jgi:pimeloyl-ACP methyl ester carboxylesterase